YRRPFDGFVSDRTCAGQAGDDRGNGENGKGLHANLLLLPRKKTTRIRRRLRPPLPHSRLLPPRRCHSCYFTSTISATPTFLLTTVCSTTKRPAELWSSKVTVLPMTLVNF